MLQAMQATRFGTKRVLTIEAMPLLAKVVSCSQGRLLQHPEQIPKQNRSAESRDSPSDLFVFRDYVTTPVLCASSCLALRTPDTAPVDGGEKDSEVHT